MLAPAPAEMLRDLRKRQAIEHPIGGHAAFARHLDAPMRQIESRVEWASGLTLIVQPTSSARRCQRQSRSSRQGLALILDGDAIFGKATRNLFDIDLISGPPQQLPSGHVAENSGVGIGYGGG